MTKKIQSNIQGRAAGVTYAIASFLLWGILPVYWKTLKAVPAVEILMHRVVWSCVFTLSVVLLRGQWKKLREVAHDGKKMLAIFMAALLVSSNWGVYIWAINADCVVQTSLGYYINPLLSVCLGMVVLRERLNQWQLVSLVLAFVGVLILTFEYGGIPWIALILAVTFGLYGLIKKMANIDSNVGLALETAILTPLSLGYLTYLHLVGKGSFTSSTSTAFLLVLAGVVTAVPLLWFAEATQRIPLSMVGFIQYLTPTMVLILGVFLYDEPFTQIHLVGFALIWMALAIFSLSQFNWMKRSALKTISKEAD